MSNRPPGIASIELVHVDPIAESQKRARNIASDLSNPEPEGLAGVAGCDPGFRAGQAKSSLEHLPPPEQHRSSNSHASEHSGATPHPDGAVLDAEEDVRGAGSRHANGGGSRGREAGAGIGGSEERGDAAAARWCKKEDEEEDDDDDEEGGEKRESDQQKIARLEAQNRFFKRHYLETTVLPGGFLDKETRAICKAVDRVEVSSILYTSTPFAAALSKVWFRRILFFVSFTLLVLGSLSINSAAVAARPLGPYKHFRFVATKLRDPSTPIPPEHEAGEHGEEEGGVEGGRRLDGGSDFSWFLHEFGPMKDGCQLHGSVVKVWDTSIQIELIEPVAFDGWYFVTSYNNPASADPIMFSFEASADGAVWERKGASGWTYDYLQGIALHDANFKTSEDRGHVHNCPREMPWPVVLVKIVHPVYCGLVIAATTFTGSVGNEIAGKAVFSLGFFFDGVIFLSAASGIAMAGDTQSPMFGLVLFMGIVTVIISAMLQFLERWFLYIILFMGCFFTVSGMYGYFGIDRDVTALVASGVDGILLVLFCLFVFWHRTVLLARARKMIEPDVLRYEAEWEALLAEEGSLQALAELKDQLHRLQYDFAGEPEAAPSVLRQTTPAELADIGGRPKTSADIWDRVRSQSFHWRKGASHGVRQRRGSRESGSRESDDGAVSVAWEKGGFGARRRSDLEGAGGTLFQSEALRRLVEPGPIRSLDQLYAQAYAVYPSMVLKVKAWAASCNGLLFGPTTSDGEVSLVPWKTSPRSESQVQFAKVKSKDRAIEKLLRSYAGDASRLVDLCRQTIVFEHLRDLARCAEKLGSDPQIQILRIKNRYDVDYPAAQKSAGYRDCLLNLRIVCEATLELGAASHICELQLILKRFALLKRKDGHKSYVAFRNVRGE